MENKTSLLWERRSQNYGSRIEGVLPKSFPYAVNLYLHNWMYQTIESVLEKKRKIKILDIGCGYGRISEEILKKFPNSMTFGIDISRTYVSLYNKKLSPKGKAVIGDIRSLPFENSFFDICFMVTTLMYVTSKADQKKAMKEIIRVLKPGGKIVIIERNPKGYFLVTLGGLVSKLRGKINKEILAVSFEANYMKSLLKSCGGQIYNVEAIPIWTLFLPLSILISLINEKFALLFLRVVYYLDSLFGWVLTPSLYIAYIGQKKI